MSLDIYLYKPESHGGDLEWSANITHNLTKMASEARIYEYVWGYSGVEKASELAMKIAPGFSDMLLRPDHYRQFDSSNGWGTYDNFIDWLYDLLKACGEFPDYDVYYSR